MKERDGRRNSCRVGKAKRAHHLARDEDGGHGAKGAFALRARPSLRAQAKQSIAAPRKERMDCFVASLLAMTRNAATYFVCTSASISTTILPVVTCSPSATSMAEIMPEIGAVCTCSIFMASSVITGCPAATHSPDLTRTATTRPFIAARTLPSLSVGAVAAGAAKARLRTDSVMPRRKM